MTQLNIRSGEVPQLIRKTAEEIAGAFYDQNRSEQFRQQAGNQRRFIRLHWKSHVPVAIESLSGLLGERGFPTEGKEKILEAILQFNERSSRRTPGLSLGRLM